MNDLKTKGFDSNQITPLFSLNGIKCSNNHIRVEVLLQYYCHGISSRYKPHSHITVLLQWY